MRGSRWMRDQRRTPVRSANERLKERWSVCLAWSLTAAAAAHLAVFAGWPGREVLRHTPNRQMVIAQLVPIAAPRMLPEPESPAARPASEAPDRPVEVVPDILDLEDLALLEVIALPPPSLADPDAATPARTPPVGMVAAPVPIRGAGSAPATPAFTWPELRNPRSVVTFLRRGYNPLGLERVRGRSVAVRIALDAVGGVEWCEIDQSSGHPALDRLALAVINEVARFTPGSRKGAPVPVVVVLSIPFEQPW